MDSVDLIIPAKNEAHRIEQTIRAYSRFFGDSIRLIVVTNGCTDDTVRVVQSVAADIQTELFQIDAQTAQGKGTAIIRGWKESNAQVVGFIDADNATPPEECAKLIACMQQDEHVHGAIASRFISGSVIKNRTSPLRTLGSMLFRSVVRLFFRMPYTDTQCGAKIIKKSALEHIDYQSLDGTFVFDVDLLWQLHKKGVHLQEIPITWTDVPGSSSIGTPSQFLRHSYSMLRALFQMRFK